MERFLDWWKQDKRYMVLCKALLLALLPILCCLVTSAAQGRGIGEVYLPGSEWNDELFYYKQVESIVEFGYPQGYYGFNESHGLKLSFAAWSPVLVLPWIVWGLLFGWNLLSPVVCNIVLMTLAVFLFGWLVRPTWKQMGVLTLLFCLYTPFVRYMLSGMPEIICISHLILFYGLAVNYQRAERAGKLAGLFVIAGLLTLMRPYMLLFLLLPVYFLIRAAKRQGKFWLGIVGSGVISGGILLCYAMIKHYFGAEYFHPLFFTDWITIFFTDGIGAGIHNFFSTLYWKGMDFYAHTVQGLRTGLASGAFFAGYLVTMAVLIWQTAADRIRLRSLDRRERVKAAEEGAEATGQEKGQRTAQKAASAAAQKTANATAQKVASATTQKTASAAAQDGLQARLRMLSVTEGHLAFSFVGMFFALLLMYKLTEGSKHLLTFMAVAIFVIGLMETRFYRKAVIVGAAFVFLYSYRAVDPYDYQIPYVEADRQAQVEDWRFRFEEAMELTEEKVPCYENVVIWVFNEQSTAGETMKWQLLYALPEGFGISCCQKEFVLEHFEELNSRYLVAAAGAETARRCETAGYTLLSEDEDIVLYARY